MDATARSGSRTHATRHPTAQLMGRFPHGAKAPTIRPRPVPSLRVSHHPGDSTTRCVVSTSRMHGRRRRAARAADLAPDGHWQCDDGP